MDILRRSDDEAEVKAEFRSQKPEDRREKAESQFSVLSYGPSEN